MKNLVLIVLGISFSLSFQSCDGPTYSEFERNNPNDPELSTFIPSPPQNLAYAFFSNRDVLITWEDTSDFIDGYIVEKSLDGIDFFTIDTLESPNLEYLDISRTLTRESKYALRSFIRFDSDLNISDPLITGIDFGEIILESSFYSESSSSLNLSWKSTTDWPFIIELVLFSGFDGVEYLDTLRNGETSYEYSFEQDFTERFLEAKAYAFEEDLEDSTENSYTSRIGAEYYTMDYLPGNVQISVINESEVMITWEDNTDFEEGYLIQRKKTNLTSSGNYDTLANLAPNSTSFTDTQSPFSGVSCANGVKEIAYGLRVYKGATGTGFLGMRAKINC